MKDEISINPSIHTYVRLSVSVNPFIISNEMRKIYLSIYLCPSVCPSIHPPTHLSILFVCINPFTLGPNNSFNEGWNIYQSIHTYIRAYIHPSLYKPIYYISNEMRKIYLSILASSVNLSFRPPYKPMFIAYHIEIGSKWLRVEMTHLPKTKRPTPKIGRNDSAETTRNHGQQVITIAPPEPSAQVS